MSRPSGDRHRVADARTEVTRGGVPTAHGERDRECDNAHHGDRVVDADSGNLRKTIAADRARPRDVETVRGVGYHLGREER